MSSSYDEWEQVLNTKPFLEMLAIISKEFSEFPPVALMAIRERFVGLAFQDYETNINDRISAANFVHVLDDIIFFYIYSNLTQHHAYLEARNSSMKHSIEHGFGTAMWITLMPAGDYPAARAINGLTGITEMMDVFADQRAHIASIAFGRECDR